MKLKFTFIYFFLILSVICLNLKKKIGSKKTLNGITSFLQNKLKQSINWSKHPKPVPDGEPCLTNAQCISYDCRNFKCSIHSRLKGLGEPCECDYHCLSGHCNFDYWLFDTYYKCT